jgi:hypothetical protein
MWEDKARQRHRKQASLAIVLLLLAFCLPGAAGAQESAETGYSVDAVIVMDQSDSMNGSEAKVKNDPDNNRLAAAEMFIAMCDMNGSRVAFVMDNDTARQTATFTLTANVFSTANQIIGNFQSITTSNAACRYLRKSTYFADYAHAIRADKKNFEQHFPWRTQRWPQPVPPSLQPLMSWLDGNITNGKDVENA